AGGHDLKAKPDLKLGYRCRPNGGARLLVQPGNYSRVGCLSHQGREHICVQDNHDSNSAGTMACPRNSGTSDLRPVPTNKLEMSVPSPPLGVSSALTALRRMSRTSSSMLRPWRWARRRKRVFTAFSMFRTTSCAMVRLPCYRDYDITISHKIIRVKNAVPVDRIGCFRGTSNTLFAKCAKEGGVPGTLVDRFWH